MFQGAKYWPVRTGEPGGLVTITSRNLGRSEVKVHGLYVASRNTGLRSTFALRASLTRSRVVIEGRGRARWYVDGDTLGVWTKQRGNPLVVRPLIEYGPGKWKKGRVLRIRVRDEFLPGAGTPYQHSFVYWLRTRRKRKGMGALSFTAHPLSVSVSPPQPEPFSQEDPSA